jgi:hypothetical protein
MDKMSDKYEKTFKWTLTQSMVEGYLGRPVENYEEFIRFCKHFEKNYLIQFGDTLDWQGNSWDSEVKYWDDPEDMDANHMINYW